MEKPTTQEKVQKRRTAHANFKMGISDYNDGANVTTHLGNDEYPDGANLPQTFEVDDLEFDGSVAEGNELIEEAEEDDKIPDNPIPDEGFEYD